MKLTTDQERIWLIARELNGVSINGIKYVAAAILRAEARGLRLAIGELDNRCDCLVPTCLKHSGLGRTWHANANRLECDADALEGANA